MSIDETKSTTSSTDQFSIVGSTWIWMEGFEFDCIVSNDDGPPFVRREAVRCPCVDTVDSCLSLSDLKNDLVSVVGSMAVSVDSLARLVGKSWGPDRSSGHSALARVAVPDAVRFFGCPIDGFPDGSKSELPTFVDMLVGGEFDVGTLDEKLDAAADLASDRSAWWVEVKSIIDCIDKPAIPGIPPIAGIGCLLESPALSSSRCLFPAAAAAAAAILAAVNPKLPKPPWPKGKGNGEGKFPRSEFDCGADVFAWFVLLVAKGVVPVLNGGNGVSIAFLGGVL